MNGKALPTVQSQLMHRNNYLQTMLIGDFSLCSRPCSAEPNLARHLRNNAKGARKEPRGVWGPLELPVGLAFDSIYATI